MRGRMGSDLLRVDNPFTGEIVCERPLLDIAGADGEVGSFREQVADVLEETPVGRRVIVRAAPRVERGLVPGIDFLLQLVARLEQRAVARAQFGDQCFQSLPEARGLDARARGNVLLQEEETEKGEDVDAVAGSGEEEEEDVIPEEDYYEDNEDDAEDLSNWKSQHQRNLEKTTVVFDDVDLTGDPMDAAIHTVDRLTRDLQSRMAKLFERATSNECRAKITKHFGYFINAIALEKTLPFSDDSDEEVWDVELIQT